MFDFLGRDLECVDVNLDLEVDVHVVYGHPVGEYDGGVSSGDQLLHRNHLGLQHLNAVSYQAQKIKYSLFYSSTKYLVG